jgi:hypothetical protein
MTCASTSPRQSCFVAPVAAARRSSAACDPACNRVISRSRRCNRSPLAPHRETQKTQPIQHPRSLPVSPATPRFLCKVRRSASRKEILNQLFTRTALNPRSAEVWRQTGREREFRAPTGSPQCGGLCAKPVVIGDFSTAKSSGESSSRKDWRPK